MPLENSAPPLPVNPDALPPIGANQQAPVTSQPLENQQQTPPPQFPPINAQQNTTPPTTPNKPFPVLKLTIAIIILLVIITTTVGGFFAYQKYFNKDSMQNKSQTKLQSVKDQELNIQSQLTANFNAEQRLVYIVSKSTSSDSFRADKDIYSVKLDGTDSKLIYSAKKDALLGLNSEIWPFYDSLIVRGEKKPLAIIDNQGQDLTSKYRPDNFEFGYFMDFFEPTLSPDGKKISFIIQDDKGIGSQYAYCQSGGKCPVHIRDVQTNNVDSSNLIKFDSWSFSEFLPVAFTSNNKFVIGTGCSTTGCVFDGFVASGTWALNLETKKTSEYGLGGTPPLMLNPESKFVYVGTDKNCPTASMGGMPLPSYCAIHVVDLESGLDQIVAYNPDAFIRLLRYNASTNEIFFLERPSKIDISSAQITSIKSIAINSKSTSTSTLTPIFSGTRIIDLSNDTNYVIFSETSNLQTGEIKIKSHNLKNGQEYLLVSGKIPYSAVLIPDFDKRQKIGGGL